MMREGKNVTNEIIIDTVQLLCRIISYHISFPSNSNKRERERERERKIAYIIYIYIYPTNYGTYILVEVGGCRYRSNKKSSLSLFFSVPEIV